MRGSKNSKLKTTKAERLLYLINLIKSRHDLTSKELAEKCGVSERTVFRDLNSLASANFPIYYDNGYKFLEGAFLPTLNLTDEEFSALQFAFEFSPLKSNAPLFHLAKDICAKLETAKSTPSSEMSRCRNHTQKTEATPANDLSKFSTMFKLLNLAIAQKKAVKIKYRKRGNRTMETLIEPYALVQKNPQWQVLCFCHGCNRIAFYDTNKIENISLTSHPFQSKLSLDKIFALHQ